MFTYYIRIRVSHPTRFAWKSAVGRWFSVLFRPPCMPSCDALRPLWSLEGHGNPDLLMIQRIFEVAGSRFWPCFAPAATRTRGFADLYYPNLSNILEMIILHDLNWSRESPSAMINELFQGMVTMTYEASGWFWLVQIMSMWLLDYKYIYPMVI